MLIVIAFTSPTMLIATISSPRTPIAVEITLFCCTFARCAEYLTCVPTP
jgi:hypothetical protein